MNVDFKIFLIVLVCAIFLVGCGGGPASQESVDKDPQSSKTTKPEPKMDKKPLAPSTPASKDVKPPNPLPPPPTKAISTEWLLVIHFKKEKDMGEIIPEEKQKLVTAIQNKWFKDKLVTTVDFETFNKNYESYEGKKVVQADIWAVDTYRFFVKSYKIEKIDGSLADVPLPDGPKMEIKDGPKTADEVIIQMAG